MFAKVRAVDIGYASADGGAVGEVKLVRGAVDGVVFDGGGNIEPGLLEAETYPARSSEQIDAQRVFFRCRSSNENLPECSTAFGGGGHIRFYGGPLGERKRRRKLLPE